MKPIVYMTLLHYPILDKWGGDMTTSITNMDIHDGGRLAATYGIQKYFLVSPIEEQQELVRRICSHWVEGKGGKKTPARKIALERVFPSPSLEDVCNQIQSETGQKPILIGTSAKKQDITERSYEALQQEWETSERVYLLVFGTGWGISETVSPSLEMSLPPIDLGNNFNHLSVRAAMAITLDRLFYSSAKNIP